MNDPVIVYFGNTIRAEREKQGLSQEHLADLAGVHRTYIGMVERAEKNITLRNIQRIACALRIEICDLFTEYRNSGCADNSHNDSE